MIKAADRLCDESPHRLIATCGRCQMFAAITTIEIAYGSSMTPTAGVGIISDLGCRIQHLPRPALQACHFASLMPVGAGASVPRR